MCLCRERCAEELRYLRAFSGTCWAAFTDPSTRILTVEDQLQLLQDFGIDSTREAERKADGFIDLLIGREATRLREDVRSLLQCCFWTMSAYAAPTGSLAGGVSAGIYRRVEQASRGAFDVAFRPKEAMGLNIDWSTGALTSVDKGLQADKNGVQLHWVPRLIDGRPLTEELFKERHAGDAEFTLTFKSEVERRGMQRIFIALENTMYATSREYGSSPTDIKDVMNDIFQNPFHHRTFAFYYKHPIFRCQRWFAMSVFLSQLLICTYVWYPFAHATDLMQISSQVRLIRLAAHRHIYNGLIVNICVAFFVVSCLTKGFMFDKDYYDEGVLIFVTMVLHALFGGMGAD